MDGAGSGASVDLAADADGAHLPPTPPQPPLHVAPDGGEAGTALGPDGVAGDAAGADAAVAQESDRQPEVLRHSLPDEPTLAEPGAKDDDDKEEEEEEEERVVREYEAQDDAGRQEQRERTENELMALDKAVLVFSRAGKPIYSSYGDEFELSSVFSLLQAMLAKTDDRLRVIRAGPHFVMVFAVCGPLLLAVSSRRDEPIGYLQQQLEYVNAQLLFHFTFTALEDTFRRKPGYDLRAMLGGIRNELEGIVESAATEPAMMLEAVCSLQLPADVRTAATNILFTVRQANLLYAVLLAGDDKLVTHVSPKRHPLLASDLLLLINFVRKAKQLRTQETWTPLCLPGFNSTGFLHAYAAYVSPGICLLLLSSGESLEQFHYCSESKLKIADLLARNDIAARIEAAAERPRLEPASCEAASSIHLVYRSLKLDQYFETSVASHAPLHATALGRSRLLSRYINVSERLHSHRRRLSIVAPTQPAGAVSSPTSPSGAGGAGKGKPGAVVHTSYIASAEQGEIWDVRDTEAVLGIVNPSQYELYATFHIFTSAAQAMACATRFAAWVRNARQDMFMLKPPTW